MALTEKILSTGPRPPGSQGIEKARATIRSEISAMGFSPMEQAFSASTPVGTIEMVNLSYVIEGKKHAKKALLVAHYDSKRMDFPFLGANDAASSVALLLSLSPAIRDLALPFDVEIVFVDGEEALVDWSPTDSLYGSRHYVSTLSVPSIAAAIVVDMVGDADLSLIRSARSAPNLVESMAEVLDGIGRKDVLEKNTLDVEDDHVPFADAGIPVLHLMDFRYGGTLTPGTYWHTKEDTLDRLSASSLSIVGRVILGVLASLSA